MLKKLISALLFPALLALAPAGCGEDDADPVASGGKGSAVFTSWGEEFIEDQIPAGGEGGLVDGWTVKYSKFLVVIGGVAVADASGKEVARMSGTKLVDHVKKGVKTVVSFPDLPAQAYENVSYEILPADAQTELLEAAAEDKELMVTNGYSVYVEGSATKEGATKTFKWGFTRKTRYLNCKSEQGGKETDGIIITNGGSDTSELTIHGDHFFYDRLQADPEGKIPTNLRFEVMAKADDQGNKDGEVTLDELEKTPIDLSLGYDPSGFNVVNMKDFVSRLSRTTGHFRGEGECSVQDLAPRGDALSSPSCRGGSCVASSRCCSVPMRSSTGSPARRGATEVARRGQQAPRSTSTICATRGASPTRRPRACSGSAHDRMPRAYRCPRCQPKGRSCPPPRPPPSPGTPPAPGPRVCPPGWARSAPPTPTGPPSPASLTCSPSRPRRTLPWCGLPPARPRTPPTRPPGTTSRPPASPSPCRSWSLAWRTT